MNPNDIGAFQSDNKLQILLIHSLSMNMYRTKNKKSKKKKKKKESFRSIEDYKVIT
jgi:hypothetical protein